MPGDALINYLQDKFNITLQECEFGIFRVIDKADNTVSIWHVVDCDYKYGAKLFVTIPESTFNTLVNLSEKDSIFFSIIVSYKNSLKFLRYTKEYLALFLKKDGKVSIPIGLLKDI